MAPLLGNGMLPSRMPGAPADGATCSGPSESTSSLPTQVAGSGGSTNKPRLKRVPASCLESLAPPPVKSRKTGLTQPPRSSFRVAKTTRAKVLFWEGVRAQYKAGQFCDLSIHVQGGVVRCHSLVLAAASPVLKEALLDVQDEAGGVWIPEGDFDEIKAAVDFVYLFLAEGERPARYAVSLAAFKALGIQAHRLNETCKQEKTPAFGKKDARSQDLDQDLRDMASLFQPRVRLKRLGKKALTKRKRTPKKKVNLDKKPCAVGPKPEELEALKNPELCQSVIEQIKTARGTLAIDVQEGPMKYLKRLFEWAPFKVKSLAFIGLRRNPDEPSRFEGLPLAWPLDEGEDPFEQYEQTGQAFKSVLGFSNKDAFYQKIVLTRSVGQDVSAPSRLRSNLKKQFARLKDVELKDIIDSREVQEAVQRTSSKTVKLEPGHIQVELDEQLEVGQLDCILHVAVLETGEVKGRLCQVLESGMDDTAHQMASILLHIWSDFEVTKRPNSLHRTKWSPVSYLDLNSKKITDLYWETMKPAEKHFAAELILKTSQAEREAISSKTVVCEWCGRTFPVGTNHEEMKFAGHKRKHYFENHRCGCDVELVNYQEKRRHVLLHHEAEGKYVGCELCLFVGSKSSVMRHVEKHHGEEEDTGDNSSPVVQCQSCHKKLRSRNQEKHFRAFHAKQKCPLCNFTVDGTLYLKKHLRKDHPAKASEILEQMGIASGSPAAPAGEICDACGKSFSNSYSVRYHHDRVHKEMTCQHCGQVFVGSTKLSSHQMLAHPDHFKAFQCKDCGKQFMHHNALDKHRRVHHPTGKEQWFQCEQCPRHFIYRSDLQNHRVRAHFKTPIHQCRAEGCQESFYDNSARYHHEKKAHGLFQQKSKFKVGDVLSASKS